MSEVNKHQYVTAQIQVDTQTGEVWGLAGSGNTMRLSPVNCRVLLVLIQNAGNAVSRQQIFDAVWPNQVVSDDALTRCISDLRAQLKPLTEISPLIGTIPKLGYRWLSDVTENQMKPNDDTHADGKSIGDKREESKHIDIKIGEAPTIQKESLWARQLKPMLWALAILLMLLWTLMSGLYWWYQPTGTSVVILPTHHVAVVSNDKNSQQIDIAIILKKATQKHENLQYLSQFAVRSHQGSPFPYFSHEFGVRWFIESRMEPFENDNQLTLNLVDAKTALVIYSQQFTVTAETLLEVHCQAFVDFVAEL